VLSAALRRSVINTYGQDLVGFAGFLPYNEFTALADAVAAVWPCEAFETVAARDLLPDDLLAPRTEGMMFAMPQAPDGDGI
jgi:hypothetical protein